MRRENSPDAPAQLLENGGVIMEARLEQHARQQPSARGDEHQLMSSVTMDIMGTKEAPDDVPAAARVEAPGFLERAHRSVQVAASTVRSQPGILLIPLAVLAFCLGVGIFGVLFISNSISAQEQDEAVQAAVARAHVITENMQLAAVPAHLQASYVLDTPGHDWPTIEKGYKKFAGTLLQLVNDTGGKPNTLLFLLAPAGICEATEPQTNPRWSAAIGLDLLKDESRRPAALEAIRTRSLYMAGPVQMVYGYIGSPVRVPIFVDASVYGPNHTFNTPNNTLPYNCPECFAPDLRFWGFSIALLNWEIIRSVTNIDVLGHSGAGYKYRLVRPPQGLEKTDYILAQGEGMSDDSQVPDDAVRVPVQALTDSWTLYVWQSQGWHPTWHYPVIAAVVLVSVALAVFVGLTLGWSGRYKIVSQNLIAEKQALDSLLARQYKLIACFGTFKASTEETEAERGENTASSNLAMTDQIKLACEALAKSGGVDNVLEAEKIQLKQVLGQGSFGTVYLGEWHGSTVAVKRLVLPASMSNSTRAEKMAIMEVAISRSMCHPHLVQTFTYNIRAIKEEVNQANSAEVISMPPMTSIESMEEFTNKGMALTHEVTELPTIDAHEVSLVLEYCDRGSLRALLDARGFDSEDNEPGYAAILETAADIAKGMLHLHRNNVLHADLKASNVMLKSAGRDGRGFAAKLVDFGLSVHLDNTATSVGSVFQGSLSHMAPEVMAEGKQSKAADVYSFGVTLWELFTGGAPYQGVPRVALAFLVVTQHMRPAFPGVVPTGYKLLVDSCWQVDPDKRPSFVDIVSLLQKMRAQLGGPSRPLRALYTMGPASEMLPEHCHAVAIISPKEATARLVMLQPPYAPDAAAI